MLPNDEYKLHVLGISDTTTKDGLWTFMELISGVDVQYILFGSISNAMLTFIKAPDLEKMQKTCSTKPLDGKHLTIEQVNFCDCIKITRLGPKTTHDIILFYFANPKLSGGGDVKKVEYVEEETTALVFFEDYSVVDNVVRREHTINRMTVKVAPYYPFLGVISESPGGGNKEKQLKIDPQSMDFIKEFLDLEFQNLLQKTKVQYSWETGSEDIVLFSMDDKIHRTELEYHFQQIADYLHQVMTHKLVVSHGAFQETLKQVQQKCSSFKLSIEGKEKESVILVRGKRQDVKPLVEYLHSLSEDINKKIEFEKSKIITNAFVLTMQLFNLLCFMCFIENIKNRFKDLEAWMTKEELEIYFRGPKQVVTEASKTFRKIEKQVTERKIELPNSIATVLASDQGNMFLSMEFKSKEINAVVSFEANEKTTKGLVTAIDRTHLDRAVELIKNVTGEEFVKLKHDPKSLSLSDEWQNLLTSLHRSLLVKVTTDLSSSTVGIAGIKEDADNAKAQILTFLQKISIINRFLEMKEGRKAYLARYESLAIKEIEESLKGQSVTITIDESQEGITVQGTRDGAKQALKKVQKLVDQVKERSIDLDKPGMKKLFSEDKGEKLLVIVEKDHKCIIERCKTDKNNKESIAVTTDVKETSKQSPEETKMHCDQFSCSNDFVATKDGSRANTAGIKIDIIKSDLAKEVLDAIVNTVSIDLDLSKNPCAKALSQAAGPGLQKECKGKGPLKAGDMVVTKGYNLGCKNVFHVVAGEWGNGNGKILRSLINTCLKEADKRGFSSIAFPAIGTGNLGFPRDKVARLFFEEVDKFKMTSVSDVHFVLYHKDTPTIQAFENEEKNYKGIVNKRMGQRFLKSDEKVKSGIPFTKFPPKTGEIKIEIIKGDLGKEKVDAIVNTVSNDLDLSKNPSAAALSQAAGPGLQQECKGKGPLKAGDMVVTKGYNLGCTNVFHVVAGGERNDSAEQVLRSLINICLKEADKRGFSSVAFPAIGTGNLGFPRNTVARVFFEEVETFKKNVPQTSVSEVHFVLYLKDETTIQAFEDEQKTREEAKKRFKKVLPERIEGRRGPKSFRLSLETSGAFISSVDKSDTYKMSLTVFSANTTQLDQADVAIKQLISDHIKESTINDPTVKILSKAQENRIVRLEGKHSTEIVVEKDVGRITISGVSDDVSEALKEVYQLLKKYSEEEHRRQYAEAISKTVQWYYIEDNDVKEAYEKETNATIEQAHADKKDSISFTCYDMDGKRQEYKIDFLSNTETNLNTHRSIRVERKELEKGNIPDHWEPQPKDLNGKEKDIHLVQLDPNKDKEEYDDVQSAITKTSPINIVKIERVQNPELYRVYMIKKQKMDDKNGSNEKKLFHGTEVKTCRFINSKGFNRSFCGKNGTNYGRGVYFARDASYSMQRTYSPPDSTGIRCMYLASVLVGEYTVGNKSMITPPPKNPNNPTITYDSTVDRVANPGIFVAYYDNQVYPGYLITFK